MSKRTREQRDAEGKYVLSYAYLHDLTLSNNLQENLPKHDLGDVNILNHVCKFTSKPYGEITTKNESFHINTCNKFTKDNSTFGLRLIIEKNKLNNIVVKNLIMEKAYTLNDDRKFYDNIITRLTDIQEPLTQHGIGLLMANLQQEIGTYAAFLKCLQMISSHMNEKILICLTVPLKVDSRESHFLINSRAFYTKLTKNLKFEFVCYKQNNYYFHDHLGNMNFARNFILEKI